MEETKIMISVPLELFLILKEREEQISVIERLTNQKGYLEINELRAIIAAPPLPEQQEEARRSFAEMFEDVPGMEEMACT